MDALQSDELLSAVFEDDAEHVRRLLDAGCPIAAHPRHGNTPLRMACQRNALRALRALLEGGADPNERITFKSPVDKRVEQDFTPLMYASSPQAIDLLVGHGADVNAISATGLSSLMRFAHFGNAEAVQALLSHAADTTLQLHPRRGHKARTALELCQEGLKLWESIPQEGLKPEAEELIDGYRRTQVLLAATAS